MSTQTPSMSPLTPTQARLEIEAENDRNIVKVPEIIDEFRERLAVLFTELIADGYDSVDVVNYGVITPATLRTVVIHDAVWEEAPPRRGLMRLLPQPAPRLLHEKKTQPIATWSVAETSISGQYGYTEVFLSADDGSVYMQRNYRDIVAIDYDGLKAACNYVQAMKLLNGVNRGINSIIGHREHLARMAELERANEASRAEHRRQMAELEAQRSASEN